MWMKAEPACLVFAGAAAIQSMRDDRAPHQGGANRHEELHVDTWSSSGRPDGFSAPISHWPVYGNERHPMKSPIQRQLEIFSAALERPVGPERDAFLAQACAGDASLRQQVDALLAGHENAGTFLDKAAGPVGPSGTRLVPITEKAGDKIGRYKLLQQIGEGGCGVVYMADQEEPVRRRVALKVIKVGMDTKQMGPGDAPGNRAHRTCRPPPFLSAILRRWQDSRRSRREQPGVGLGRGHGAPDFETRGSRPGGVRSCLFTRWPAPGHDGHAHRRGAPLGTAFRPIARHAQGPCAGRHRGRFSPDGKTLATASHDRKVKLWNVATHQELATFPLAAHLVSARFSPDGRALAIGCLDERGMHSRLVRAPSFEEIAAAEGAQTAISTR